MSEMMKREEGIRGNGYLMSNEFKVEVKREGWEMVANLLRGVEFSEFLSGGEVRLDFSETKDLDVSVFFVKWALSKELSDVVVKLGSGKRELIFRGCSVDSIFMDSLSNEWRDSGIVSESAEENWEGEVVGVAIILRFENMFIKEKNV